MKKVLTVLSVMILALSLFGMSVFAADAPAMAAKAGTPELDGKISDGEYGSAVVLNAGNTVSWTGGKLGFDVTYCFAWSSEAFYVAISVPTKNYTAGDAYQLNFNPGGLIPEDAQGLFLGLIAGNGAVTINQYNWANGLADKAAAAGVDVTGKMRSKVGTDGDNTVIEVEIPLAFFRITTSADGETADASSFELKAGPLTCNPFMVLGGNGYTTANCSNGTAQPKWTVKVLNLASVTLDEGDGQTAQADPTEKPAEEPTEKPAAATEKPAAATKKPAAGSGSSSGKTSPVQTFDLGIVSLAAMAITTAAAIKRRK